MKDKKREIKRAAAISYDPAQNDVPVLTAFGEGHIAQKMVDLAEQSGVPVMPDPSLASMLAKLSVGDDIPPALYEVVAKVLLFVGDMDRSYGERIKRAAGK